MNEFLWIIWNIGKDPWKICHPCPRPRKNLKNISFKGRQIINLCGVASYLQAVLFLRLAWTLFSQQFLLTLSSLLPIFFPYNLSVLFCKTAWVFLQHLNKTYKTSVPLVLMNSFNTDEETQKVIRKYKGLQVEIYTFNQSCFPRINRESLLPIAKNCNIDADLEAWVTKLILI